MNFHVVTIFPNLVLSYMKESILARAIKEKIIKVMVYNPRDYIKLSKSQKGKKKPYIRIDDKPYGGGPGMVIQAEPILKTVDKILKKYNKAKVIFFSPAGKNFNTEYAKKASKIYKDIILICGRYEGIDFRVKKILKAEEVSIGDYILTGGEIPAMILIDSISRQIEGVLGNFDSREEERVSSSKIYTRPEILEYKGKEYKVPKVLLSGNHKKIDRWKILNDLKSKK